MRIREDDASPELEPHENVPLFVVGLPRSGTTLLYHILILSGAFPVYRAETRILLAKPHYGPLTNPRNRARFSEDFLESRQFARSGLQPEEIGPLVASSRDYYEFLALFMNRLAVDQGKTRWVEKTPTHLQYLLPLAERFPTARFLHIIRDGRDVALSIRKLGWTPGLGGSPSLQLLWGAQQWRHRVERARAEGAEIPGRFVQIRFEDLILNLESVLESVSEFAQVRLDPERIQESQYGSLGRANTAFAGMNSGLSRAPLFRWKNELTDRERDLIDLALHETLARNDYELPPPAGKPPFRRALDRLRAEAVLRALQSREWVRDRTWLGRLAGSPLEIGLD